MAIKLVLRLRGGKIKFCREKIKREQERKLNDGKYPEFGTPKSVHTALAKGSTNMHVTKQHM